MQRHILHMCVLRLLMCVLALMGARTPEFISEIRRRFLASQSITLCAHLPCIAAILLQALTHTLHISTIIIYLRALLCFPSLSAWFAQVAEENNMATSRWVQPLTTQLRRLAPCFLPFRIHPTYICVTVTSLYSCVLRTPAAATACARRQVAMPGIDQPPCLTNLLRLLCLPCNAGSAP
jgi:hypothetical protein